MQQSHDLPPDFMRITISGHLNTTSEPAPRGGVHMVGSECGDSAGPKFIFSRFVSLALSVCGLRILQKCSFKQLAPGPKSLPACAVCASCFRHTLKAVTAFHRSSVHAIYLLPAPVVQLPT